MRYEDIVKIVLILIFLHVSTLITTIKGGKPNLSDHLRVEVLRLQEGLSEHEVAHEMEAGLSFCL